MTSIDIARLHESVGLEVGVSDWLEITQERIDRFAEATEDRQWIHVDTARAAVESPFKATIAHGFLTLSMISALLRETVTIGGCRMAINYGTNRVRFVSPVPAGARIRGRFTINAVEDEGDSRQVTWAITIDQEGRDKPALVAEWIVRYYPAAFAA
jgi:acyl dehydratase